MYSDIFEEVIQRDEHFGPMLRKVKTVYDAFLRQALPFDGTAWASEAPGTKGSCVSCAFHTPLACQLSPVLSPGASPLSTATPTPPLAPWETPPTGERRIAPGSPLEPMRPRSGLGEVEAMLCSTADSAVLESEYRDARRPKQDLRDELEVKGEHADGLARCVASEAAMVAPGGRSWVPPSRSPPSQTVSSSPGPAEAAERWRLPAEAVLTWAEARAPGTPASALQGSRSPASPVRGGSCTPPAPQEARSELAGGFGAAEPRGWAFRESRREPEAPCPATPESRRRLLEELPGRSVAGQDSGRPPGPASRAAKPCRVARGRWQASSRSISPSDSDHPPAAGALPVWRERPALKDADAREAERRASAREAEPDPEADAPDSGAEAEELAEASADEAGELPQRRLSGPLQRPSSVPRLNLMVLAAGSLSDESDGEGPFVPGGASLWPAEGCGSPSAHEGAVPAEALWVPACSTSSTASSTRAASTPPCVAATAATPCTVATPMHPHDPGTPVSPLMSSFLTKLG